MKYGERLLLEAVIWDAIVESNDDFGTPVNVDEAVRKVVRYIEEAGFELSMKED